MSEYYAAEVRPDDRAAMDAVDRLLAQEGIRRDPHLDYTCALYGEDGQIAATGSSYRATLRCFAVDRSHQGEGLVNRLLTHMIHRQAERGNYHLFLYTKPEAAPLFGDLGFHEIARVPGTLVFMENRRNGFSNYLQNLAKTRRGGVSAAVVMNANPFTLGHLYLAERAAASCDALHLFIVSEDLSVFPFAVRKRLVELGTAHIPNVILHDCGPYLISSATFPSYFLRDAAQAVASQAALDVAVFKKIAGALNVTGRWVGEEPNDAVTAMYNRVMSEALPEAGIRCTVLPRTEAGGSPISASAVRDCFERRDYKALQSLVPPTTLDYLMSPEAEALRAAGDRRI